MKNAVVATMAETVIGVLSAQPAPLALGAHTWVNWRNYLDEFAPKLFQ
jgi:hypothetical protein